MTHHWDEFSKSLVEEAVPRRESLRRLGIALAGTVLSPLGVRTALAGHKPPTSHHQPDPCKRFCKCRNKSQQNACLAACSECNGDTQRLAGSCGNYVCCVAGVASCGSYCANLGNDWNNCGACGHGCYVGYYESGACIDGQCEYWCVGGTVRCDGICTHLGYDPNNCGACGNVCGGPDPHCNDGVCSECYPGLTNCGGSCTDLARDNFNCGACGNVCGPDLACNNGVCTECAPGLTFCTDQNSGYVYCSDLLWDDLNCGACGHSCDPGYCSEGYCYGDASWGWPDWWWVY